MSEPLPAQPYNELLNTISFTPITKKVRRCRTFCHGCIPAFH
jgi:hypothetical protein